MNFFRAVPSQSDVTKRQYKLLTRRLPSNIPYFVDNLWEYLRPTNKPSRRHAVYASPSPELALENASAFTKSPDEGYQVYALVFETVPRFMQLDVTDARYHPDIKALQRMVQDTLGLEFASLSLSEKLEVAPLFMPGVSAQELAFAGQQSTKLQAILDKAISVSTFWQGSETLNPLSKGELFFELEDGDSYSLQKFENT